MVENSFKQLFENLILRSNERLASEINKGNVYLSAPVIVLEIFKKELQEQLLIKPPKSVYSFMGVFLIPSHEMKIVLFHKQCTEYSEPWMKIEINL